MITIYGAQWCGHCKNAKKYAETKGLDYEWLDVDDPAVYDEMKAKLPDAKKIPQIFVDGEYVGGYDKLREKLGE